MRSPRKAMLAAAIAPLILLAGCATTDNPDDSTNTAGDDAAATSMPPHGDFAEIDMELVPAKSDTSGSTEGPDTGSSTSGPNAIQGGPSEVPSLTYGGKPFAEGDLPFSTAKTQVRTLAEGKGKGATADQDVETRYLLVNGTDGQVITSSFPTDQTVVMPLYKPQLLPGLVTALTGAKPGESLIVAMPPTETFGTTGLPQQGIAPADTLVAYIEVVSASTPLTKAEGKAVPPVEGLPTVEADGTTPAKITIPPGVSAPTDLEVQPLIKGEGKPVEPGQTITVQYTGVTWATGEQFDSSLQEGRDPIQTAIGVGQVIPAWDKGLVGQTVGSRVLIVTPPSMAYGSSPTSELKDETLVFVIDILKAE